MSESQFIPDRTLLGTFLVDLNTAGAVKVMANNGLDFLIIDGEHGLFDFNDISRLIDACVAAGIRPLVRAPSVERGFTTRVLDAGARGIMYPQVRTIEQVREAVAFSKYTPLGTRGVHRFRPHTNFMPPSDYLGFFERANREVWTIIQIETSEAAELVGTIAAMDGVDSLFVGPTDLSVAMGCAGEFENAKFRAVFQAVIDACRECGKIPAVQATSAEDARRLAAQGFGLVSYAVELSLLGSGVKQFVNTVDPSRRAKPA